MCWKIHGEGETVDSTLSCEQLEETEGRVPASQRQGTLLLAMDTTRLHRAKIIRQKVEGSRDGVAIASTPFLGLLSVRFSCISKPGELQKRMTFREPQGSGVRTTYLDRVQISRLLEERTRTTAGAMENDRENARKVPRRSQECPNC